MIKSTIRTYLVLNLMFNAGVSFIGAVYVVFLTSKGLTIFEAQAVNAFCFAALTLFEVPTGIFADMFGRKKSFIAACLLLAAGMFVYSVSGSFSGFVFAEIISALGMTFASGSFQAWFVDTMRHHGHEGSMGKIFALRSQLSAAAVIAASLIGAFLADKDLSLPWIAGGSLYIITAIFGCVLIKEEYFNRKSLKLSEMISVFKGTVNRDIRGGLKKNGIRFILAMSLIQCLAFQAPNMEWQILFKPYFYSNIGLGVIKAAVNISLLLGAFIAMKSIKRISRNETLALASVQVIIGAGIAMTVIPIFGFMSSFAFFMIHEIGRGAYDPIRDSYLNDHIPSESRATMLSLEAMARRFGGTIGLIGSGLIAAASITGAWISSGVFLLGGSIVVFCLFGKKTE